MSVDAELVDRYRKAQGIPASTPLTLGQVTSHWELERHLTEELLASTPENRWSTFEAAYSRLYAEFPWLHADGEKPNDPARFRQFADVIGDRPLDIYEVGSGQGSLLLYLSGVGHRCKGTEITRERGAGVPGLEWGHSDGVHLQDFEAPGSFDLVLSSQVVEHLHPEDLVTHLRGARSLLRPGGRYIIDTPHRLRGPADVSDVFGYEVAAGMHLKEYTFREIREAAEDAGYTKVRAVIRLPVRVEAKLPFRFRPRTSAGYLSYLELLERLLRLVPTHALRRRAARAATAVGFQMIMVELQA